jgi:hypothetical protein
VLCSCCRYEVRPISDLLQEPLRSAFDKATKAYLAAKDAAWKKVNKCPKSCGNSKGFHGTCVGDRCKCPTGANQKFAGSGCTCAPGYTNTPNGECYLKTATVKYTMDFYRYNSCDNTTGTMQTAIGKSTTFSLLCPGDPTFGGAFHWILTCSRTPDGGLSASSLITDPGYNSCTDKYTTCTKSAPVPESKTGCSTLTFKNYDHLTPWDEFTIIGKCCY